MGQQTIQTDRRAVPVPAADDRIAALRANAEAFHAAGQLIRDGFQAAQARAQAELARAGAL